LKTKVIPR